MGVADCAATCQDTAESKLAQRIRQLQPIQRRVDAPAKVERFELRRKAQLLERLLLSEGQLKVAERQWQRSLAQRLIELFTGPLGAGVERRLVRDGGNCSPVSG